MPAYTNLAPGCDALVPDSSPTGLVFDIMRFSVHDGPGIRTTVFFKGCPLRCWWCHNPEGLLSEPKVVYLPERCIRCGDCVSACPNDAISWNEGPIRNPEICHKSGHCAAVCPAEATQIIGRRVTVDQLMQEITKDSIFFEGSGGGVTFSGGEPFLAPDFLEAMLDACRGRGIHAAVETCGVVAQKTLLRLASKVDLFLYDVKVIDRGKHIKYTGAANDSILANLLALARAHQNIIVRIPVIPEINIVDSEAALFSHFLRSAGLCRVDLLPYHDIGSDKYRRLNRPYLAEGIRVPAPREIDAFAERLRRDGFTVRIGG